MFNVKYFLYLKHPEFQVLPVIKEQVECQVFFTWNMLNLPTILYGVTFRSVTSTCGNATPPIWTAMTSTRKKTWNSNQHWVSDIHLNTSICLLHFEYCLYSWFYALRLNDRGHIVLCLFVWLTSCLSTLLLYIYTRYSTHGSSNRVVPPAFSVEKSLWFPDWCQRGPF